MNKKWIIKLAAPVLALAIMNACGTPNNTNDNQPQDTNTPEDINAPGNEAPNNYTPDNNRVPENDVDNNQDQGIDSENGDMGVPNSDENENRDPHQG